MCVVYLKLSLSIAARASGVRMGGAWCPRRTAPSVESGPGAYLVGGGGGVGETYGFFFVFFCLSSSPARKQ